MIKFKDMASIAAKTTYVKRNRNWNTPNLSTGGSKKDALSGSFLESNRNGQDMPPPITFHFAMPGAGKTEKGD